MTTKKQMTDEFRREMGKRLIAARQSAGYPYSNEFARLLDLKPETYRRYERGEVVPDYETLMKIRELTNSSLDWLISGKAFQRLAPKD